LGLKLKLAEALPKSFNILATYLKKAQLDLQTAILPNLVTLARAKTKGLFTRKSVFASSQLVY